MQAKRINVYATRMVRTDTGKKLRKLYESHQLKHGFNEHRTMEVGGLICNSITTIQKDTLICEQFSIT